MQGQDVEAEITLTLEEAHRGGARSLSLQAAEPCTDCGGSGSKDGEDLSNLSRRGSYTPTEIA